MLELLLFILLSAVGRRNLISELILSGNAQNKPRQNFLYILLDAMQVNILLQRSGEIVRFIYLALTPITEHVRIISLEFHACTGDMSLKYFRSICGNESLIYREQLSVTYL